MKLKNKQTNSVGELLTVGLDRSQKLVLMVEVNGIRELYMYDSLSKLNEEWEDADGRTIH